MSDKYNFRYCFLCYSFHVMFVRLGQFLAVTWVILVGLIMFLGIPEAPFLLKLGVAIVPAILIFTICRGIHWVFWGE